MKTVVNDQINILDFFFTLNKLKGTPRSGWHLHKVPGGNESVADHSFQVAIMAMFLANEVGVDQAKSVQMALIHDIGEAIIGDEITERGNTDLPNSEQKHEKERIAVKSILEKAGMKDYLKLFDEFTAGETLEAKFVKQLDKLETAIQAKEYSLTSGINLDEFYINARKHITNQILLKILDQITTN